ncbi:unnamed protein product [Ophioblennius macclurei]
MGFEELVVRLNDGEYKNWLKAGRCLVILKDAIHPFTDQNMRDFHADLLKHNPQLKNTCRVSCQLRTNKLCSGCSDWKKEILRQHRQPNATINWDNCTPAHWRKDHWEVAKAYMPRGQASKQRADQCDAAALLNLINHCNCFWFVDPKVVREVIRSRNELMHSTEFRVKDEWMRHFQTSVKHFVRQVGQKSQMEKVMQQVDQMLKLDLSISVAGMDFTDGLESDSISQSNAGPDFVRQWEAELLEEVLQEVLHSSAEDGETDATDTEHLQALCSFLEANTDLGERFSVELQAINSLKAKE